MSTTVIILIVVIAALVIGLAVAGVMLSRSRSSAQLQDRYGPEYERTLAATGDRRAAEAELAERDKRHSQFDVRELRPEERERYAASWAAVQREFVDDPDRAVNQADALVADIMSTRGYPTDDEERRADDLSVAHPQVVAHYRQAREIRQATAHGVADTEQQRHAVTSYRELIDALLDSDSGRTSHTDPSDTTSRQTTAGQTNGRHADVNTTEEQTR